MAALGIVLALAVAPAAARKVPTRGDLRLLIVLAGFPDRPLANQRAYFTGSPDALVDRLVAYFTEVSSGRLRIVPVVGEPVVTLPQPRASYVQRPAALAEDALVAFAAVATAPADRSALRDADALVVFFAGAGRESHTTGGDPKDPWSNYTPIAPPAGRRVAELDEAAVIAEEEVPPFSNFGVLCHEFGHVLGLPELYAPGGAPQEGIGVWGLMGQGTWLGRGAHPPHPCAWSKLTLGWVDPVTVERSTLGVILPAVETEPRVVKIPATARKPAEYYLVEHRARIGADRDLPGEGILVWHVDESVTGFRTGQTRVEHKLLHLVEADGRNDLDRGHAAGGNRGDAGDAWVGPPAWRRRTAPVLALLGAVGMAAAVFRAVRPRALGPVALLTLAAGASLAGAWALRRGPVCGPGTPGMAPYDGSPVAVAIRNLSPLAPVMRFDVLLAPSAAADGAASSGRD